MFRLKIKSLCQQEMEYHSGLIILLWQDLLRWPEKFSSSLNCQEKDVLLQTDLLWLHFQKWFFFTTKDTGLKKGYLDNSSLTVTTLQSSMPMMKLSQIKKDNSNQQLLYFTPLLWKNNGKRIENSSKTRLLKS